MGSSIVRGAAGGIAIQALTQSLEAECPLLLLFVELVSDLFVADDEVANVSATTVAKSIGIVGRRSVRDPDGGANVGVA